MAQANWRTIILALLILIILMIAAWLWWPAGSDEAMLDLAPAVTPTGQAVSAETQTDNETDAQSADATDSPEQADSTTAAPPASAADEQASTETTTAATGTRRFVIDPEQSEARFIIDEILFGDPNTVVGSTNVVSGALTVDLDDLSRTTVDPIVIDAGELATDNRFRNRSLSRLILQSNRDEYQYITFTPTAIAGLPNAPTVGAPANLELTGDLQIRDIVQPATFAVTVTATSDTRMEGLAVATVQRAAFDLQIPDVDGVAEVAEDVRLEFDFVAVAEE